MDEKIIEITEDELFSCFKQDLVKFDSYLKFKGGNCASIALIKAAIGTYGVNGIFLNIETDEENKLVRVQLRNEEIVEIYSGSHALVFAGRLQIVLPRLQRFINAMSLTPS